MAREILENNCLVVRCRKRAIYPADPEREAATDNNVALAVNRAKGMSFMPTSWLKLSVKERKRFAWYVLRRSGTVCSV